MEEYRFGGDLKRKTQRPWYTLPNDMDPAAATAKDDRIDTESFVERDLEKHTTREAREEKSKKRHKEKKEKKEKKKHKKDHSEVR